MPCIECCETDVDVDVAPSVEYVGVLTHF